MAISGPQGLTPTVFGTLKPPQNKGEPFTFLPDSANNLIPCDFIPDGGSTGASPSPPIPGTYKTASGPNSPGVFNPSDPNAASRETTHGNIVMKQPPNSPPIPGRLEPNDPSAGDEPSTSRLYPDPFGSYKVTFTPDELSLFLDKLLSPCKEYSLQLLSLDSQDNSSRLILRK
jgi:hypothetical protein